MSKYFCTECESDEEYTVTCHKYVEKIWKGEKFVVDNYYTCKCNKCGAPMGVLQYEHTNDEAILKAYNKLRNVEN